MRDRAAAVLAASGLLALVLLTPSARAEEPGIRIGYLQAPAALAFIAMREQKLLEAKGLKPEYYGFLRPQANIDAFLGGRPDVAIAGSPEPARFRNKGMKVKIITCALKDGIYMVVPKGAAITRWEDLKGKRIGIPSAGTAAALLTRNFLRVNGLDPERDLSLITVTPAEGVTLGDAGQITAFPVWEPFVTRALATGRYRVAWSYVDDWRKGTGERAPWVHGVVMAREEYLATHPQAVEKFKTTFLDAVRWVYANLDKASELAAAELKMEPKIIREAMSRTELCTEFGEGEKRSLMALFKLMHSLDADSVGGAVPGPDLFQ